MDRVRSIYQKQNAQYTESEFIFDITQSIDIFQR